MSIVNHFSKKIFSAQRNNILLIQILCKVLPKRGSFRGDFLFLRRKGHARVRSVLCHIMSWCRKTLHI